MNLRRRQFITLLGGAATWPLAARAQQASLPIIGFLDNGRRENDLALPPLRQGLRELGFVEGQNVLIEYRWADDQNDRLPVLAADLVQRRVAVIVAVPNTSSIAAAKAATSVIPIVFMSGPDPVRTGLVASLNRPGGNLTGETQLSADLTAKRFGLLHDLAPQIATVAMLVDGRPGVGNQQTFNLKEAESAGRSAGVRVVGVWVGGEADFDSAFASAIREGAGAVLVASSIRFVDHRDQLAALATRYRLPAIYQSREYADAGGLMSYGPSAADIYRQVGVYTGRVLKGEKPADMPVVQPTKYELVINLKAAKALSVTIPPNLIALADEVIE